MNETQKKALFERYNARTHLLGRVFGSIALLLLLAAPFVIGAHFGALPNLSSAARAFLAVGLVWIVTSSVEYLIYTPMLGAGGSYLAFITGNLVNLKIPCAVTARDIVDAKVGTPENEIISTLSIATSSLVTILVLAIGVAILLPLRPLLQSPVLQPAFEQVVPALFGAMAYKYFRHNLDIALPPLFLLSLLFCLVPALSSATSFMILPGGALAIGIAWWKFRKTQENG